MKKYFVTAMVLIATTTAVFAQKRHKTPPNQPLAKDSASLVNKALQSSAATNPQPPKPKAKVWDLSKRSADHFMVQFGYDNWANKPDSANISGFNHSFNFYFMLDFPFKQDPRMSFGAGLGIGSNNVYFNQTYPQVGAYQNTTLVYAASQGGSQWKSFKLVTTYLEIPLELRYALDPEHMDKSWKFAIGVKLGVMLNAYTKASTPVNNFGQVLGHTVEKESSTQFFNTTKLEPTVRISKGVIGIYGQYQVTSLVKSTAGQNVFPFAFGIVLSGL